MRKKRAISPDFVSRQEAADRLMLSPRQIDRMTLEGKLPKVKVSANRSGIPRAAFEQYLETRPEQNGSPQTPRPQPQLGNVCNDN